MSAIQIPCFVDLLERCRPDAKGRADLTRLDVVIYGVLVFFDRMRQDPSIEDIARLVACKSRGHNSGIRERLAKLEKKNLIWRVYEAGKRTRYILLGPYYDNEIPRREGDEIVRFPITEYLQIVDESDHPVEDEPGDDETVLEEATLP